MRLLYFFFICVFVATGIYVENSISDLSELLPATPSSLMLFHKIPIGLKDMYVLQLMDVLSSLLTDRHLLMRRLDQCIRKMTGLPPNDPYLIMNLRKHLVESYIVDFDRIHDLAEKMSDWLQNAGKQQARIYLLNRIAENLMRKSELLEDKDSHRKEIRRAWLTYMSAHGLCQRSMFRNTPLCRLTAKRYAAIAMGLTDGLKDEEHVTENQLKYIL
ncbi:hypothetical protein ACOME3_009083 [Neoechinorhynchus agilis]